jgi:UDPglucose 6-dehydrogenase
MRVSFFNELDSFAMNKNLNPKNIIEGVCKDKRIGEHYNNPSFGYGGYCLPKDTKQLLFNYQGIPNELISAIVKSNKTRKNNIVENIISKIKKNSTIGIYRLVMKEGSDNFRSSSIFGIISRLEKLGYNIKVFEPKISSPRFMGYSLTNDLECFKKESDLILCNRLTDKLNDVSKKVYTRDIFNEDK